MSAEASWRPRASNEALRERARMLAQVRDFFADAGVTEVSPPLLGRATVTAVNIHSAEVRLPRFDADARWYLQTSPEYAMKRLLAAGSGPIYAIVQAFRDGEAGRLHNPEFTLLEWYRPGFVLERLMQEVRELLSRLLPLAQVAEESYRAVFIRALGVDPFTAGEGDLAALCRHHARVNIEDLTRDDRLDLLFSHAVQPALGPGAVIVSGFPATQAALAEVDDAREPAVARRFELFVDGIELANAYQELTDAAEHRRRFDADRAARRRSGLPEPATDEALLGAIEHGLPACSGVAVGLDRVLMHRLGVDDVRDTLAFPFPRA